MSIPTLEFLTGLAGSGKTTELRRRIQSRKDAKGKVRSYGILTATTGIAAINLSGGNGDNVITLNSQLKYFDTASLQDNFASRRLHNQLKEVSRLGDNLSVDEISMMDAIQLDLIHDALLEVNELREVQNRGGLGLVLCGDFAQLPPVKAEYAFTAKCWKNFTVTKLDKVWRQSDPLFLEALNAARRGDGEKASRLLCEIEEVQLRPMVDSHFEGTTIVPINKLVDSINKVRLDELIRNGGRQYDFPTYRWGRQHPEWKQIPEVRTVAKGAYVMILANDTPRFSYANGSCGTILDADIDNGSVTVKLKDGGREVKVRKVTRCYMQKDAPEGRETPIWMGRKEWEERQKAEAEYAVDDEGDGVEGEGVNEDFDFEFSEGTKAGMYKTYLMQLTMEMKRQKPNAPYFNFLEEKWVIGEVTYTPVRLAYAATVHKTQGLSLDCVQIDYSHAFFGEPSMSYVALSRVRTPGGLTIVGNRRLIEDRTNISSEILEWV